MKRQLISIGAVLLVCSLIMCVGQEQAPDKFFETYNKIDTTQKEIDETFNSYWDQQAKRIDYSTKNINNHNIDYKYIISMLKSEQLLLDELNKKNTAYSAQVSELYETVKEIKGDEAKSSANNLVISLRKSEQYLGNAVTRYSSATNAVGIIMNYYAIDANLSNPSIKQEIENQDLTAKTDFQAGDEYLGQYYLVKDEANATYQELLKMK